MKEYLLLFRGGDEERKLLSPQQKQEQMERWQAWIADIAGKGLLVGAQPLENGGKVLKGTAKKITDGPFMEGKEILGGYVLIRVRSMDEAIHISEGCPNLEAESGSVEIREIGTMSAV